MAFIDAVAAVGIYIWILAKTTGWALFVAPLYKLDILWTLIPIWLGLIIAELFQERKAPASMGSVVSNGVVTTLVGIDWMRTTINFLQGKTPDILGRVLVLGPEFWIKMFFALAVVIYGIVLVFSGVKNKKWARNLALGRIRVFIVLMLIPVYYMVMPMTWIHVIATIVFLPVFYWIIEGLNRIMPRVQTESEEK